MLNIVDKLNEWIEPFNDFINKNHDNPIVWFLFFIGCVAIITMVFDSLHKNE